MDADVAISNRAWIELLHAEVCWALNRAGVDALVIKGPSIGEWLYPEGRPESADVDVLVRPGHCDAAVEALAGLDFADTLVGFRGEEPPDHSVTLARTDESKGHHGVDVHRYFPGIERDPEAAFDIVWSRRTAGTQADLPVWFPDEVTRALLIALHEARDPLATKTYEDLRRALAALTEPQLDDLALVADELDAQAALRAGLEAHPDTAAAVDRLGLGDVEVPLEWALLSHAADGTAWRLGRLAEMPLRQRPGQVTRWLFPSPALMRYRNPEAAEGTVALARAYAVRLGQGARRAPRAVRQWRDARRSTRHRQ